MNYKEKLKDITTFILDVDGVLTDGKVYLLKEEVVRALNSKDGYALQYASKNNYAIFKIRLIQDELSSHKSRNR